MNNSNLIETSFGLLKKRFPGYIARPQQIKMSEEVNLCLNESGRILIEAGTGVGKSFAYLIPAINSKEKTIISTGTIALQSQLFSNDLASLKKILPIDFTYDQLKGKNNYVCLKRENELVPQLDHHYNSFKDWLNNTKKGDKDELPFIPEFWSNICCDSNDCNGKLCKYYDECFYYSHYKHLFRKDILIINHHLLIHDLLSDYKILPFHNHLIIDEAHQLEDIISNVYGSVLNHSRFNWLLFRLKGFKIATDHLIQPIDSFFKRFDTIKYASTPIPSSILDDLINIKSLLDHENLVSILMKSHEDQNITDEIKERIDTTVSYLNALVVDIVDFVEQADRDKVYFIEETHGKIELKSRVVDSSKAFNMIDNGFKSIVMTSATLTVDNNYNYFKERLGIKNFKETVLGSPFDYKKQALLYVDNNLPIPSKENSDLFFSKGLTVIENLIEASSGRALVLFTSYSHLRYAKNNIKVKYKFKSQGDMPPSKLVTWFKETPESVLLATSTFWQGIDIKGNSLCLVIIVKLPFGAPGNPVYDERCRRLGNSWFKGLSLPSAILLLRQGFGRLIRDTEDFGVIAILDNRVIKSSYGNTIISSLPDINIVNTIDEVREFYDHK